jgi:hypothetical protein
VQASFPELQKHSCSSNHALKSFGPEQCVNQVGHNDKRHYQSNYVFDFHIALLQTIAGANVQPRDHKKENRNEDKYEIGHLIRSAIAVSSLTHLRNQDANLSHWKSLLF